MKLVWNVNSKENICWCGKSLFDFVSEKYGDLFLKIENSSILSNNNNEK